MSEDPARDGNNWFAYAGNNPINYIDSTGLAPVPAVDHYYKSNFRNVPMMTARDDSDLLMNLPTGWNTDRGWTFSFEGRYNQYQVSGDLYTPEANYTNPFAGFDEYRANAALEASSLWGHGYIATPSSPYAALFGLNIDTNSDPNGLNAFGGLIYNSPQLGENLIANIHGSMFGGKPGYHFSGDDGPTLSFGLSFTGGTDNFAYGFNANFTLGQQASLGGWAAIQGKAEQGGFQMSGMAYVAAEFGSFASYGSDTWGLLSGGYQGDVYAKTVGGFDLNSGLGTGQIGMLPLGNPGLGNINWTLDGTGNIATAMMSASVLGLGYYGQSPLPALAGSYSPPNNTVDHSAYY